MKTEFTNKINFYLFFLGFVVPYIFKYSNKTSNQPWLETRPLPHSHSNRRLRQQFERAPDDGHNSNRNMLSDVYVTKQEMLRLIVASGLMFYLKTSIYIGTNHPAVFTDV
jgi:hypothetical protein